MTFLPLLQDYGFCFGQDASNDHEVEYSKLKSSHLLKSCFFYSYLLNREVSKQLPGLIMTGKCVLVMFCLLYLCNYTRSHYYPVFVSVCVSVCITY